MIRLRLRPLAAVGGAACGGSPPFMPKSTLAPTAAAGGGLGIMTFLRESPYKAGLIIATLKTAACDLIVQKHVEKKEKIDWQRQGVFWLFGFGYLGAVQWFIYVDLFKMLFPGMEKFANQTLREKLANPAGLRALAGQVAFDNFVHYPLLYFPVFYLFKEAVQGTGGSLPGGSMLSGGSAPSPSAVVEGAMSKYRKNALEDNLKIWLMWVPADAVIYAVPIWLRLPLNHGLSFVWMCYLSFLRGDEKDASPSTAASSVSAPPGPVSSSSAPGGRGASKLPWTATGMRKEPTTAAPAFVPEMGEVRLD